MINASMRRLIAFLHGTSRPLGDSARITGFDADRADARERGARFAAAADVVERLRMDERGDLCRGFLGWADFGSWIAANCERCDACRDRSVGEAPPVSCGVYGSMIRDFARHGQIRAAAAALVGGLVDCDGPGAMAVIPRRCRLMRSRSVSARTDELHGVIL